MSESMEDVEQSAEISSVASVGKMLMAARERAGLTIEEAASQLRLSVRQVNALEADDSSALPAPTFVRGFIRNYAKLLGVDVDQLLQAYRVVAPELAHGNITLPSENITFVSQDKKVWLPYLLASVVVGLALVSWMVYMEYAVNDGRKPVSATILAPVTQAPILELSAQPKQAVEAEATPVPVVVPAEQVVPAVPAKAGGKLNMTFTAQSWVSVTDHDGKELFNKSQLAGSQNTIEGSAPFTIVIGNANGVQLTYNDKQVDLAPYTKANVARLTLE